MWLKNLLCLVILLGLGFANNLFAEENMVVFDDISQVYYGLNELPLCKEGLGILEGRQKEVDVRLELEEEKNKILVDQLQILSQKFNACEQVNDAQEIALTNIKDIVKMQAEGYEEILKVSKPSFFDQLKNNSVFIGIGIALGILLF